MQAEMIWEMIYYNQQWYQLRVSFYKRFKAMCMDSDIVQNITLWKSKLSYVVIHGLSP